MSPVKSKATINGHRPSPLKITKESHFIHKSSSSSAVVLPQEAHMAQNQKQKQRQPVIIYTHSPKIIHTQPRDFMALVQKLTGLNSKRGDSDENKTTASQKGHIKAEGNVKSVEANESSSGTTDENCGRMVGNYSSVDVGDVIVSSSFVSPIMNTANPFLADMPLFTPNSMNFFFSPRSVDRFEDSAFASPSNKGN